MTNHLVGERVVDSIFQHGASNVFPVTCVRLEYSWAGPADTLGPDIREIGGERSGLPTIFRGGGGGFLHSCVLSLSSLPPLPPSLRQPL